MGISCFMKCYANVFDITNYRDPSDVQFTINVYIRLDYIFLLLAVFPHR